MTITEQCRLEGMQQGMEQGRFEGQLKNSLEIAERLLNENHPIDFIERITKLSAAQIKALQEKETATH